MWLRGKMNNDWGIKLFFKIFDNLFYIFVDRFDQIDGAYSMELLSCLFDIEVESNIVLSEIFNFEKWGYDIMIGLIENDDFPCIVSFLEYV